MHNDELNIDCELVRETLCRFIRDETETAGVARVVVGISGGVDSAVAGALAARALGCGNVVGVAMPYETSPPESSRDAELVIAELGIESLTVDITAMVNGYLDTVPEADRIRRGNVMARARMTVLYDQSAAYAALVLGTGNKTEHLLGYTTLWGDMACAINPLGDLYKTQVWQLADALGIPDRIINKPPTADLWAGQTDEAELGFSYRDADRLLYHLIDRQSSVEKLAQMGFDPGFINTVRDRIEATAYKRRMPRIAELSDRPVDREA